MKSITITEKGQIAIPKQIREVNGFAEGSKIIILAFRDHIELRPLKQFNDSMFTAIASEKTLAKQWNLPEEDKAWKNL